MDSVSPDPSWVICGSRSISRFNLRHGARVRRRRGMVVKRVAASYPRMVRRSVSTVCLAALIAGLPAATWADDLSQTRRRRPNPPPRPNRTAEPEPTPEPSNPRRLVIGESRRGLPIGEAAGSCRRQTGPAGPWPDARDEPYGRGSRSGPQAQTLQEHGGAGRSGPSTPTALNCAPAATPVGGP